MTDAKKFSGRSLQLLVTSGIFDYLPIWAPHPPADPAGSSLGFVIGQGIIGVVAKQSNFQDYLLDILSPTAKVELQTYYFPGWKYWLDGKEVKDYKLDPLLGRPQIDISSGRHELLARLTNTPIRTVGNSLSIFSWLVIFVVLLKQAHDSLRNRKVIISGN